MIILSNIAAMLAAPSLAISVYVMANDPQEDARIAYNNCLVDGHNNFMNTSMALRQFELEVVKICTEERQTYYDVVFKLEKEFDASDDEAAAYAEEECDGVLQSIISAYASNLDGKIRLVKS